MTDSVQPTIWGEADLADSREDLNESIWVIYSLNFSEAGSRTAGGHEDDRRSGAISRYRSRFPSRTQSEEFPARWSSRAKKSVRPARDRAEKLNRAALATDQDKYGHGSKRFSVSWNNKKPAQVVTEPENKLSKNVPVAMGNEKSRKQSQRPSKCRRESKTV